MSLEFMTGPLRDLASWSKAENDDGIILVL